MAYDSSDAAGSNELDRNPDPLTGAPGSHPLGTGIGASSGALTGAAVGALGGPVGAAIGIIAGGIVGAITGHKAGEYNDPTEDFSRPGDHADPMARTTNPTPTASTTTSGRPADTSSTGAAGSSSGSSMTSSISDTARSAGDSVKSGMASAASAVGLGSGGTGSGSSSSRSNYASLDKEDTNYFRSSHKSGQYADRDFDRDLLPAYGYGTEVSRQSVSTGGKAEFSDLDTDLRTGWDQVRASSTLDYDQARPAIEEAYHRTLRLHEERLKVNKNRVETGDVSIRKEIITEQKQIEVPVEREEVVITTRSLTGEAADGAMIGEGETIRVPVSEERVNVEKEVVPTGEVRLDKKKIQETKTVVDNIRKEAVKIDKTGDVRVNEETGSGSR